MISIPSTNKESWGKPVRELIKQAKWIIALLLLAALGTFALQNTAEVELDFLVWSFQSRRIVVIAVSLGVGLAIGWLFGLATRREH